MLCVQGDDGTERAGHLQGLRGERARLGERDQVREKTEREKEIRQRREREGESHEREGAPDKEKGDQEREKEF
jgi:hypothetical protein